MNQAYFLMVMKKNLINRPKTDDGDGLVVAVFGGPGSTQSFKEPALLKKLFDVGALWKTIEDKITSAIVL